MTGLKPEVLADSAAAESPDQVRPPTRSNRRWTQQSLDLRAEEKGGSLSALPPAYSGPINCAKLRTI